MQLSTFSTKIEAEVERAYGVVAKIKLSPQLSYLREQIIRIDDQYVALDKVVKRANKVGSTRKSSKFSLAVWVEVESQGNREVIHQCCQGKCKGKNSIALFRTFAVLAPDTLEFEAPIIFYGAPSHNHRGKKAKFILKMSIMEGNNVIAVSSDFVIPYKQSSSKKRQRSAKEEEDSDIEHCGSGSQGNSTPSSPPLAADNNTSYSPKRAKSFNIDHLLTSNNYATNAFSFDQPSTYYAHDTTSCLQSNSCNDLPTEPIPDPSSSGDVLVDYLLSQPSISTMPFQMLVLYAGLPEVPSWYHQIIHT